MSFSEIKYCPSTLSEGFNSYSPTALKKLFNGKKVSHILPFDPPHESEEAAEQFRLNRRTFSISGVQVKQSLILEKNRLRLTKVGENGMFILKPIPRRETIGAIEELPANEHVTMQIARQVYKLNVAENAIILFKNGEPAYLTRRFDIVGDGTRTAQEDFASLMLRTRHTHGEAFKNEGSYEAMSEIMRKTVAAYPVEIEKFFALVLFNYLFSNGDAHLKNFSLQRTDSGDYLLSPAYDLINTRIHIQNDTAMALSDGLFTGSYLTESYEVNGFYAYDDFYEFGSKTGISDPRIRKLLDFFRQDQPDVKTLVERSFLGEVAKKRYIDYYEDRLRALNYSYSGKV